MSKPILSELEYNASDVASSILSQADLQVANDTLGITDISDHFSAQNSWVVTGKKFYKFQSLIFCHCLAEKASPGADEEFLACDNSDYFPNQIYTCSTMGYEGDYAYQMRADTDGTFWTHHGVNVGVTTWYGRLTMWYCIA